MAVVDKEQPKGSLTHDEGNPAVAQGTAGTTAGAHSDVTPDDATTARNASPKGDLEERRETQQVLRPTTDGVGEGLAKDAG